MKKIILMLVLIVCLAISITNANQNCISGSNSCNNSVNLNITLYNSYSWDINYLSGNLWQFESWWYIYISNLYNQILVSATDSSIYTISGNIYTWSIWWWSGNYTNIQDIYINSWDGEKYIQSNFLKIAEFYNSNIIKFILDQTAPNKPVIKWPSMWSLQNNIVTFEWTPSIDTGIGFSGYYIYFSLNPNWPYSKVRVWSDSKYIINSNLLPSWTIYRYIWAIDYLWNESEPVYWYFHNKLPTILNGNSFNTPNINTSLYSQEQTKEHFVANIEKTQLSECKVHGYDDFSDCKAIIDKKYMLKDKIYESYFAIKWLEEDKRLLPSALPNSGVETISENDINNKEYDKLLPKSAKESYNNYCISWYINNNRLAWLFVLILSLYIVYDKTSKKNDKKE